MGTNFTERFDAKKSYGASWENDTTRAKADQVKYIHSSKKSWIQYLRIDGETRNSEMKTDKITRKMRRTKQYNQWSTVCYTSDNKMYRSRWIALREEKRSRRISLIVK